MRMLGKLVLTLGVAALLASPASAQGRRGGFPGFGGGGGGILFLLSRPDVQKELDLKQEDVAKIRAASDAATEKVVKDKLSEKQFTRLKQLQLQQRGVQAYTDAKIQKELKFTEEQKDQVKTIQKDLQEGMKEVRKMMQDQDFQGAREKGQEVTKDANDKLGRVLTAEQKKSWKKMLGKEFKFEQQGRGRRGRQNQ